MRSARQHGAWLVQSGGMFVKCKRLPRPLEELLHWSEVAAEFQAKTGQKHPIEEKELGKVSSPPSFEEMERMIQKCKKEKKWKDGVNSNLERDLVIASPVAQARRRNNFLFVALAGERGTAPRPANCKRGNLPNQVEVTTRNIVQRRGC